jgi:hypothetical protein
MPARDNGVIRLPLTEAAVQPEDHMSDCELVSLARDTRDVADSIPEPAIRDPRSVDRDRGSIVRPGVPQGTVCLTSAIDLAGIWLARASELAGTCRQA